MFFILFQDNNDLQKKIVEEENNFSEIIQNKDNIIENLESRINNNNSNIENLY